MTQSTPLPVIQADREAAADIWRDYVSRTGECIVENVMRTGKGDDYGLVQAFVKHRIEHSTPDRNAVLEVAKVWEALKDQCCADPDQAKRCVMVSKDDLRAALQTINERTGS